MASIKMKIDSSKFQQKTKDYAVNVRAKMQAAAPEVMDFILHDILSRTPNPDREEALINFGEEGPGALPVTNVRQSSNNSGRQTFIRQPGMWIQDAILEEAVNMISPAGFSLRIGNLAVLNELTKFSWQDSSKKLGDNQHTSTYGTFDMFEFGTNVLGLGHVRPAFGTNYYLTPMPYTRIPEMDKTIPPFGMYTHLNIILIGDVIVEKIREVQF